jgi:hypothetical protein
MRNRSIGLGLMLCASLAHADTAAFTQLEQRLSDALAVYDAKTIDRLWDEHLVFVFPNGKVAGKAERLAAQVPPPGDSPKLLATNDQVEVRYEDRKMAVVIVKSSWRLADSPPQHFVASHIWIHRRDGWRLICAQVARADGAGN